jgi:protein-S-isoprenylcysteine O-methyltransferase Ste14
MTGIFRHLAAILILPFTMAVLVPTAIVAQTRTLATGWGLPFPLNLLPIGAGVGLIAGGLALVAVTVKWFITVGHGTLAPWDPTRHLVITGVYRYVRNPMISGVITILLGEAVLFGSLPMLLWAVLFMAVNFIYMPLVEEPDLQQRFGAEYDDYTRHVPRWLPRRRAWTPTATDTSD